MTLRKQTIPMDFSSLESKDQLKEMDDVIRVHTVGEESWEGRLADLQIFRFQCLWRISLFALQWGLGCCMLTLLAPTDLYQGEHTYGSRRQTRNRNLEIQKQRHPQNTKYQELKLCAARDLLLCDRTPTCCSLAGPTRCFLQTFIV